MLSYYLRLASKSFRRTPGLTGLMICAIACGIGACIVTLTVYHAVSGNPIWWKNNVLYAVTMDSWDPTQPADSDNPTLPPPQLTYRDATYLMTSSIPKHKAIMTQLLGMLSGARGQRAPVPVMTRATTADFFPMFDVPFEFGGGWNAAADQGPGPVMVLSHTENEKLFGGANSVGQTLIWNGRQFRIIGVLKEWQPAPRFYDLNEGGGFSRTEDAYVPFNWAPTLQQMPSGHMDSWGTQSITNYQEFINSESNWIEMWVELPTAASRADMLAFMNSYWAEQRKAGRFQRPINNHLTNVGDWLKVNHVVSADNSILLRLAFAFLAVCLINTIGILLAKFLKRSAVTGLLRALGASRRQIFWQHLVEVGAIAAAGATAGVVVGIIGLKAVQALYDTGNSDFGGSNYAALAHFDPVGIAWALGLAALSTVAAGLYPAWTIGRLPPSRYLKSQ
ncbi:MAG TPA: ABC transporter permease [Steroidobacteraceae bacterium]